MRVDVHGLARHLAGVLAGDGGLVGEAAGGAVLPDHQRGGLDVLDRVDLPAGDLDGPVLRERRRRGRDVDRRGLGDLGVEDLAAGAGHHDEVTADDGQALVQPLVGHGDGAVAALEGRGADQLVLLGQLDLAFVLGDPLGRLVVRRLERAGLVLGAMAGATEVIGIARVAADRASAASPASRGVLAGERVTGVPLLHGRISATGCTCGVTGAMHKMATREASVYGDRLAGRCNA